MKNYEQTLESILHADQRVLVLTAENRAHIKNFASRIGDRFIDVGIAEQTMIGIAAGLALTGNIPVVHALAAFLTMRAFEFIRTDVGIPNLPIKIVGSFNGLLSEANGPTHQAIEDVSLMRGIPNINIFCPSDEEDLIIGLPQIIQSSSPFYIRYTNQQPIIEHSKYFEIGKAEVFSEGYDVAILTYGYLFKEAIAAKKILDNKGVSVGIVNLRTLKPIDEEIVIQSIKNSQLTVTLEDHFITGGLFSIVSELLVRNKMIADILPIGFNNAWFKPALLKNVLTYEGLNGEALAKRILLRIKNQRESFTHIMHER